MRIVSLLPAATEWLAVLGVASELVGRSHACDYPPRVRDVPAVTRPRLGAGGDTKAIHDYVQASLGQALSLYDVDLDALRTLRPDLLLTQAQCEVCAVSRAQLDEALDAWIEDRPRLVSFQPMTFKQVLDQALHLGRIVGRTEAAMRFIAERERQLNRLREQLGLRRTMDPARLPTVACVEWLEPLMTAGHWMPDVAELAGGQAVLAEKSAPSRRVEWAALRRADPDVIAVMPCGFTLDETIRDLHYLTGREGWGGLRATRTGRVYLFDGNAYFNRPGPRLYRAVRLLASALYPDCLAGDPDVQSWERRTLKDVSVEKAS